MIRPVNVQPNATFEVAGQREPRPNSEAISRIDLGDIEPLVKAGIERHWLWQVLKQPDLLRLPRELFPGLAYEGIHTLFAGREKLGKSEILGLVAARAQTDAPIIYFSFEEHRRELAMRTARYGVDPTRLCIVESIDRLSDIRTVIEEEGAEFAIIDSLSALMRSQLGVTDSENTDTWGGYVQRLTATAHEVDASILTSHHATKETGSYRGHSSIGGGVDLIVEMFKDKQSESQRRFQSIGRVRGVKVPALTWTGSLYTLEADTDAGFIRRDIRTLLHSEPGLSSSKIAKGLNRRRGDVLRVLNQMFAEGELLDLNDNPQSRAFVNADEGARFPETDVSA